MPTTNLYNSSMVVFVGGHNISLSGYTNNQCSLYNSSITTFINTSITTLNTSIVNSFTNLQNLSSINSSFLYVNISTLSCISASFKNYKYIQFILYKCSFKLLPPSGNIVGTRAKNGKFPK